MKQPNYFQNNSKNSLREKYHLYKGEKLSWLQVALRLESSIISIILPWVIFCTIYGTFISFLDHLGLPIGFSDSSNILTNAVLSFNIGFTLLLVFRTNTAHDRFWEGRQLWGALVNTSRNLTRGISIIVKEKTLQDKLEKEAILRLVTAFAVAMKLHLRSVPLDTQLAALMSEKQYLQLQETNHPPLQIAYWIGDYLQYQHDRNCLNIYQLTTLHNCVDDLVDILGGCERILKTPLPLIYTIKLRQLLLIFCLILPLEIVSFLNWWTGIVMAFVSFTLLSIEQIGSEIEEPFGFDPNDLPLNTICNTISNNVEELIRLTSNNIRYY
ncbi:bestrophin family protein [Nostoc sp. ChiQUE01b]|uniref:bestrophin family protein n=1 Tax=Nostoc sp. ChiQUE01b TaxID=3075376 RepID=UPI002AD2A36E|nr:bestrophin family ion channel [Nostoc sp. ChiQUE01b]MDZ8259415.1 bestrophin family ion channel [Nostoc sp. ChiQUE01b]